jgi:DNA modification methylase
MSGDVWQSKCESVQLHCGDALRVLPTLERGSVQALITDPPYSSGGVFRSDRSQSVQDKYQQSTQAKQWSSFSGDNRDQRSFLAWSTLWLLDCFDLLSDGGYALVFTDWRQLPVLTDAVQAAGFIWRGLISWDKGPSARAPHKGYFRHQCEYVVWGTKGPLSIAEHDGPYPGCIQQSIDRSDKHHLAGKPVELLAQLCRIVKPGDVVLDPFLGSGTTARAAVRMGRRCIGIELDQAHFDTARRLVRDELSMQLPFGETKVLAAQQLF